MTKTWLGKAQITINKRKGELAQNHKRQFFYGKQG